MTSLDLTTPVPGAAEALERGCSCPGEGHVPYTLPISFCFAGYFFDPNCPVHRHAVLAEVQRQFGRPQ